MVQVHGTPFIIGTLMGTVATMSNDIFTTGQRILLQVVWAILGLHKNEYLTHTRSPLSHNFRSHNWAEQFDSGVKVTGRVLCKAWYNKAKNMPVGELCGVQDVFFTSMCSRIFVWLMKV